MRKWVKLALVIAWAANGTTEGKFPPREAEGEGDKISDSVI